MQRDELLTKLQNIKLDPAYADRWFVLFGDVNARDHGSSYVQLDAIGFNVTSVYPASHDPNDCDIVTSWVVNEYSGSYADLIDSIDNYVNMYASGDLPSFVVFMENLIYTHISDGLGHSDSQTTNEPHHLFSVNGSIPPLAFHLG
jgi:hypothetical protein